MDSWPIDLSDNPDLCGKLSGINFASMTIRLFKTPQKNENIDFGDFVFFQEPGSLKFDEFYTFNGGEKVSVCRNTLEILKSSRYS